MTVRRACMGRCGDGVEVYRFWDVWAGEPVCLAGEVVSSSAYSLLDG